MLCITPMIIMSLLKRVIIYAVDDAS